MSLIQLAASAMGTTLDAISANWADVTVTSPATTANNANVTVTYSGGTRTIRPEFSASGTLRYRIDSGSYTTITSGASFSCASGSTLNFQYESSGPEHSATISVYDNSRGTLIDTFGISYVGALDAITADWGNISVTAPTSTGANSNVTVTYSGGTRTIRPEFSMGGTLQYRINSGSYTSIASGATFSCASGSTLNFQYTPGSSAENGTVSVYDNTRNVLIDTFTYTYTLDAITANWADIPVTAPTGATANANITMSYSGGTRTLRPEFAIGGTLKYRVNSGSYTSISSGGTFSAPNGQTVNFEYTPGSSAESATISVYDNTRSVLIDTFVVSYTLDAITANWANIPVTYPTTSDVNSNVTITYSGGTRSLRPQFTGSGSLSYRVNSGSYTSIGSGSTFSAPSGQTVNFQYNPNTAVEETMTVTVYDHTRSVLIDTFDCSYDAGNISASWGDIIMTYPPVPSTTERTNLNATITYGGSTRQIRVENGGPNSIQYRLNSGTYTSCPSGTIFDCPSGTTLNFYALTDGGDGDGIVTVYDHTRSVVIDSFIVSASFTG